LRQNDGTDWSQADDVATLQAGGRGFESHRLHSRKSRLWSIGPVHDSAEDLPFHEREQFVGAVPYVCLDGGGGSAMSRVQVVEDHVLEGCSVERVTALTARAQPATKHDFVRGSRRLARFVVYVVTDSDVKGAQREPPATSCRADGVAYRSPAIRPRFVKPSAALASFSRS